MNADHRMNKTSLGLSGSLRPSTHGASESALYAAFGVVVVYLVAFMSLWAQLDGLFGPLGITPIAQKVEALTSPSETSLLSVLWAHPSVFILSGGHGLDLHIACGLGTFSTLMVFMSPFKRSFLFVAWVVYLSFFSLGQPFLSFQWDLLLLESAWPAMLALPTRSGRATSSDNLGALLFRVLLFKLMLSSGWVKLSSGDPSWVNATALDYHFWTQPLPHQLSYLFHGAGSWVRKMGVWINHWVELAIPWLLVFPLYHRYLFSWLIGSVLVLPSVLPYGPSLLSLSLVGLTISIFLFQQWCLRACNASDHVGMRGIELAGVLMITYMLLIFLSGNYGFFNFLTGVIAVSCISSRRLERFLPNSVRIKRSARTPARPIIKRLRLGLAFIVVFLSVLHILSLPILRGQPRNQSLQNEQSFTQRVLTQTTVWVRRNIGQFAVSNSYGLFARMTKSRRELKIELSDDGRAWRLLEFNYKPTDVRDLSFAGLHMPRLDWQLWFSALRNRCSERWFFQFLARVLEGSEPVLKLTGESTINNGAKYVQVSAVDAEFTSLGKTSAEHDDAYWSFSATAASYCPRLSIDKINRVLDR